MKSPLYIFGAGGQAKCVINALNECGDPASAIIDDHPPGPTLLDVPVFQPEKSLFCAPFRFVVAIGDPRIRREKFEMLKEFGGEPTTVIHPDASVSKLAKIGPGTVVFANALIDPCVSVGENCIVNVGAIVGHDSIVDDDAHVSAGAVVGAGCAIGARSFIGLGALINPRTRIGDDCFIAMGAMISHDVAANQKAISPHRREAVLVSN